MVDNASITQIDIPFPQASEYHLRLRVGGCKLTITPSSQESWVAGTYDDPTGALPVQIDSQEGRVTISQDTNWSNWQDLRGRTPSLNLTIGKGKAFELTIESGASQADIDLGGLPITRFSGRQGAGKYTIDFSAPNPEVMSKLELASGAVGMTARNLANANFDELRLEGGAASSKVDFGGSLRRDGKVRITTGVSSVEVTVPTSTPARISTESVLGHLDVGDGFMTKEKAFWTEAALMGHSPSLNIHATVALGVMRLRTTSTPAEQKVLEPGTV